MPTPDPGGAIRLVEIRNFSAAASMPVSYLADNEFFKD